MGSSKPLNKNQSMSDPFGLPVTWLRSSLFKDFTNEIFWRYFRYKGALVDHTSTIRSPYFLRPYPHGLPGASHGSPWEAIPSIHSIPFHFGLSPDLKARNYAVEWSWAALAVSLGYAGDTRKLDWERSPEWFWQIYLGVKWQLRARRYNRERRRVAEMNLSAEASSIVSAIHGFPRCSFFFPCVLHFSEKS